MSWINDKDLEAIRKQANIVDVISQYLTLEKKNKSYVALCPFHDDHNPSLNINTDKQIFKCFTCGTGGDVFGFVQKIENISFPEAVVKVAQMIGYQLDTPQNSFAPKVHKHQETFDLLQKYIKYTQYELVSQDGVLAMEYLRKRHINEDVIRRFEIGYVPNQKQATQYLLAQNLTDPKCGLLADGRAVFHDRITIPIHDENGHPLAFTARTLSTSKEVPKYINTAQTEIYEKGKVVFNYHRAKSFCRKNKRCILTEGAMDVLAFEKADIHESVACLGTAMTSTQLNLLKRLQVVITVCYDGDKAGQAATNKFIEMAVDNRIDVQIVKNDTGKDPDEIYEESGKDGLKAFVEKTVSVVEFLFDYGPTIYNLENYEERRQFGQKMHRFIEATCQGFEKPGFYQRLQTMTGFDFSHEKLSPKTNVPKPTRPKVQVARNSQQNNSPRYLAEKAVIEMMLLSQEACNRFKDEIGYFDDERLGDVANYIYDAYREYNRLNQDILLARMDDESTRTTFQDLWNRINTNQKYNEDYLNDAIKKIRYCQIEQDIEAVSQKILMETDPEKKAELYQRKTKLTQKKLTL